MTCAICLDSGRVRPCPVCVPAGQPGRCPRRTGAACDRCEDGKKQCAGKCRFCAGHAALAALGDGGRGVVKCACKRAKKDSGPQIGLF